jgi:hypothetical protein
MILPNETGLALMASLMNPEVVLLLQVYVIVPFLVCLTLVLWFNIVLTVDKLCGCLYWY